MPKSSPEFSEYYNNHFIYQTIGEDINLRLMIFNILQSKVGILKPFSTRRFLAASRHQSV